MAPGGVLMTCATPLLPWAAWAVEGHLMVELLPSVHTLGAASMRNREKFCVVPDESARTAMVIGVLGRLAPALIPLTAGFFQGVTIPRKISPLSVRGLFRLCLLPRPTRPLKQPPPAPPPHPPPSPPPH